MTGRKDLTGKRFGRLTVIGDVGKRKYRPNGKIRGILWKCKCDCGNVKFVLAENLISEKTKSCGCLMRESVSERRRSNLKGKQFGELKVIKESDKRGARGEMHWICECSCGETCEVQGTNLTSGTTKSCGHLRKEFAKKKVKPIKPGTKFGKLTVLKRIGSTTWKGNRCALYLCECTCGKTIEVSSSNLKRGNSKSCGHMTQERLSVLNSDKSMIKKHETRNRTDWVEKTSLSAISPKRKKSEGKTSKKVGVSKRKDGYWRASMIFKGERVFDKTFNNEQDAINARKEAEEKYFKPILDKYDK